MATCKADGCNTIVADSNQDFCRSCRAKLASVAQEMRTEGPGNKKSPYPHGVPASVGIAAMADDQAVEEALLEDELGLLDVSDEPKARSVAGRFNYPLRTPQNGYLPFQLPKHQDGKNWVTQAMPQLLFRPEALMLWGYDDDTVIEAAYVGQQVQGAACFGDLPASFFGTAKTYEKLIEDLARNGISPPNWITWSTCNLGNTVTLQVRGHLKHAVMLGKTVL